MRMIRQKLLTQGLCLIHSCAQCISHIITVLAKLAREIKDVRDALPNQSWIRQSTSIDNSCLNNPHQELNKKNAKTKLTSKTLFPAEVKAISGQTNLWTLTMIQPSDLFRMCTLR